MPIYIFLICLFIKKKYFSNLPEKHFKNVCVHILYVLVKTQLYHLSPVLTFSERHCWTTILYKHARMCESYLCRIQQEMNCWVHIRYASKTSALGLYLTSMSNKMKRIRYYFFAISSLSYLPNPFLVAWMS